MLRKLIKQFQWLLARYHREYTVAILCIAVNYSVSVLPPWFAGHAADRIFSADLTMGTLLAYVAIMLTVTATAYLTGYIWSYRLIKAYDVTELMARQRTFSKLLNQSAPFFQAQSTGSLMGKSTNDVSSIAEMAGFGMMTFFDSTLYQVVLLIVMAINGSWQLTLLTFLPYPLLIYFSRKIGNRLYCEYDLAQQAFDDINDHVLENIQGIRVIRAFVMEDQEAEQFADRTAALYQKNMKVARLDALFMPASRLIQGISFVIALLVGASLIGQGVITIGQLMSHVFYLGMLAWPMIAMGEFINISQQATASMDRVQEIWDWREEIADLPDAIRCESIGDITFDRFSFTWPGQTEPVLKDLSFTIDQGMTLGVVGRVGSGKTALLKQLLRFYPQEADLADARTGDQDLEPARQLRINGLPIRLYDRRSIRHLIGYVPQDSNLFSLSVRDNILMGERTRLEDWPLTEDDLEEQVAFWKQPYRAISQTVDSREQAPATSPLAEDGSLDRVLRISDFEKDIENLPQGLDTLTGEQGIALSGGQKQRISIARALLADPEILILDDCLSAVDAITEKNVLQALTRERSGKTTLVSSHRLSAVRDADLILVLEDGRIAARGTHADLMREGGWYAGQYELQQMEEASDQSGEARE
ncbi:MAG: ABC transporter ATP-binding protein [Saccharofermentanales bacterium]